MAQFTVRLKEPDGNLHIINVLSEDKEAAEARAKVLLRKMLGVTIARIVRK